MCRRDSGRVLQEGGDVNITASHLSRVAVVIKPVAALSSVQSRQHHPLQYRRRRESLLFELIEHDVRVLDSPTQSLFPISGLSMLMHYGCDVDSILLKLIQDGKRKTCDKTLADVISLPWAGVRELPNSPRRVYNCFKKLPAETFLSLLIETRRLEHLFLCFRM